MVSVLCFSSHMKEHYISFGPRNGPGHMSKYYISFCTEIGSTILLQLKYMQSIEKNENKDGNVVGATNFSLKSVGRLSWKTK